MLTEDQFKIIHNLAVNSLHHDSQTGEIVGSPFGYSVDAVRDALDALKRNIELQPTEEDRTRMRVPASQADITYSGVECSIGGVCLDVPGKDFVGISMAGHSMAMVDGSLLRVARAVAPLSGIEREYWTPTEIANEVERQVEDGKEAAKIIEETERLLVALSDHGGGTITMDTKPFAQNVMRARLAVEQANTLRAAAGHSPELSVLVVNHANDTRTRNYRVGDSVLVLDANTPNNYAAALTMIMRSMEVHVEGPNTWQIADLARAVVRTLAHADGEFARYAEIVGLDPDDLDGVADPLATAKSEVDSIRREVQNLTVKLAAAQDHAARLLVDLKAKPSQMNAVMAALMAALAPGEFITEAELVGRATAYRRHSSMLNDIDDLLAGAEVGPDIQPYPWDVKVTHVTNIITRVGTVIDALRGASDALAEGHKSAKTQSVADKRPEWMDMLDAWNAGDPVKVTAITGFGGTYERAVLSLVFYMLAAQEGIADNSVTAARWLSGHYEASIHQVEMAQSIASAIHAGTFIGGMKRITLTRGDFPIVR